ncbi:glycosyltransferase family 4 protein [Candidatus Roizmanbacteria bacterium]|nr:glycosyltransferase family 4 protein [Candidatus Roizmanbacteria bacterium]
MKKKNAALIDPYLDVLGGGERYALSIMKLLEQNGYNITLFWNTNISQQIQQKLDISFQSLQFRPKQTSSFFSRLRQFSEYDILLYISDGSYFISHAKHNFVYAMIPDRKLYASSLLNTFKLRNWKFITHSLFNKHHLMRWGINSKVLYPSIDDVFTKGQTIKKEHIILSVGRFFPHLHSKRQDIIIKTFKELKQKSEMIKKFDLYLAGGLKEEDKEYYSYILKLADGDPSIHFLPNIPYDELVQLYYRSMFYWHFAGYGVDENVHPECTEHFGIAPLEAMACGAIPFAYNAGGPRETISHQETGFLFSSVDELEKCMELVYTDENRRESMIKKGKDYINSQFSYDAFENNASKIFLNK